MGHWSIGDFAKELSDIEQLYQVRNESSLVLELVNQLCLKLQSLHQPGPAFALAMFKNIKAAQLLKSKLVLQVEKSCYESSAGPLRVNCAPQSMTAPWNYMSISEWAKSAPWRQCRLESKKGCKLLKRPASKSQPAKKAKAKPTCAKKQSASSGWPEKVVYGCIRCRGSSNGCDTCRKPRFRGLKLPGRAAWVQWARENGKL